MDQDLRKYFFKPSGENQASKRKADEADDDNPYEDMNKQLRELYQARLKAKSGSDSGTFSGQEEKVKVSLDIPSKEERRVSDLTEAIPDEFELEETKVPTIENDEKPCFWLNKLRYYPSDYLKENMVSFKELMYEDLFKDPKNAKRTLEFVFMTTFGYDMQLLDPVLKAGIKFVLADEWDSPNEPRIVKNYEGYPNLTLIRSPKDPARNFQGAFHPKIWLLKFQTFLRVVIGSGNLTGGDWIIWSNCLWFKDFPKKASVNRPKKKNIVNGFDFNQDFEDTLKSFIQSLMPNRNRYTDILDLNLDDYLFEDIDVVMIPSIPGRHKDESMDKYGHRKVASALKKLFEAPKSKRKYVLTYQTSSVGNLDEKFLKEVLSSFIPNYMSLEDLKNEKKGKKKDLLFSSAEPAAKRVRMIFPTKSYVENCNEGPQYSNCLILNPDTYKRDSFPKEILHQFQAPEDYAFHEGIIPHLKVWIVCDESGEIDDDTIIYYGSHNFSPSAWGKLEKEYTQISISNTELGVLLPPLKGSKDKKKKLISSLSFKFPPQKYDKNQIPWMFREHFNPMEDM